MSATHRDNEQCIDPRLLTYGFGLGFDDPHYDLDSRALELDIGFDLATDLAVEQQNLPIESSPDTGNQLPQTPQIKLPQPSEGFLEAETGKESKRPRLTVETAPIIPVQTNDITPTTPEIRVSAPGHGFAAHSFDSGLNVIVPDIALTDDGRTLATPTPGRPRRNSSPARGNRRGRLSRNQPRAAYLSPSPSSSPPLTPYNFIREHGYHVGDRSGQNIDADYPVAPTSAPRQRARSVSGPSNFCKTGNNRYICPEPDCRETKEGKCFDTQSALNKHRRKHLPNSERPHGCNQCSLRFLYPKDLSRHKLSHRSAEERSAEDGMTCTICSNVLSRGDNLNRHMQRVHHAPPTPSSSGRSRRITRAVSPSLNSAASVSQYSLSRPGTPLPFSPTMQAGNALNQVMGSHTFGSQGVFVDAAAMPASPLLAPPMERSRSDFH